MDLNTKEVIIISFIMLLIGAFFGTSISHYDREELEKQIRIDIELENDRINRMREKELIRNNIELSIQIQQLKMEEQMKEFALINEKYIKALKKANSAVDCQKMSKAYMNNLITGKNLSLKEIVEVYPMDSDGNSCVKETDYALYRFLSDLPEILIYNNGIYSNDTILYYKEVEQIEEIVNVTLGDNSFYYIDIISKDGHNNKRLFFNKKQDAELTYERITSKSN